MPELAMVRIALSRPPPGPFTNTFTLRKPASKATLLQSCAAICAAYGVFFLEPRNPILPALLQEITWPAVLVSEIMMLLKDALMCASPVASTLTVRLRCAALAFAVADCCLAIILSDLTIYYLVAIFLLAIVLRLPLRVRAFVFVRCPRTGSAERWRIPR